jgi:hypothetical protein
MYVGKIYKILEIAFEEYYFSIVYWRLFAQKSFGNCQSKQL